MITNAKTVQPKGLVDQWDNPLTKSVTGSYERRPFDVWFRGPRDMPPFNFWIIRSMLQDPTVRLGLQMRSAPLCAAEFAHKEGDQWTPGIKCESEDVKDFIERQLERMWRFDIQKILRAQIWGWAAAEVVYELKSVQGTQRLCYDYMVDRHASHIRPLELGGQAVGVLFRAISNVQGSKESKDDARLTVGKCIWHAYDVESGSYFGRSILQGAYHPWADKMFDGGALDIRRLFMHSDAYAGRTVGYPPGTTDIDGLGTDIPNRDIAMEMVEQYKSGSVMVKPNTFTEQGKDEWTVDAASVSANPSHILQFPKDLDVEILRGMEIPDDVLMSEATGAWQGKQVPMQAYYTSLNQWLHQVVKAVSTWIIEPLVEWNFGSGVDFEITTKPLEIQAMELAKQGEGGQDAPGDEETGGFDLGGLGDGGSPVDGIPDAPSMQPSMQPSSKPAMDPGAKPGAQPGSKPTKMDLTDQDVSPQELVEAGLRVMDSQENDYSCVIVEMPPEHRATALNFALKIDPEDFHEKGVETESHVTVLYGLHDTDAKPVERTLRLSGPIAMRLGKTSCFKGDEFDVLKVEIESEGLTEMHDLLTGLPNSEKFPEYTPHMTVAYLKKGAGDKYEGEDFLDGEVVVADEVTFSNAHKQQTPIELNGPVRFSWQKYEGKLGGKGWKNTDTGKVVYQEKKPAEAHDEKTGERPDKVGGRAKKAAKRLKDVAGAIRGGKTKNARKWLAEAEKMGASEEELAPLKTELNAIEKKKRENTRANQSAKQAKDAKEAKANEPTGGSGKKAIKEARQKGFIDSFGEFEKGGKYPLTKVPRNVQERLIEGTDTYKKALEAGHKPEKAKDMAMSKEQMPTNAEVRISKIWQVLGGEEEHAQAQASVSFKGWKQGDYTATGNEVEQVTKSIPLTLDIQGDVIRVADKPLNKPSDPDTRIKPGTNRVPKKFSLLMDGGVILMAQAPAGGVTIRGTDYKGGQFIPNEVMDDLTDDEIAAIDNPTQESDASAPPPKPKGGMSFPKGKHQSPKIEVTDSSVKVPGAPFLERRLATAYKLSDMSVSKFKALMNKHAKGKDRMVDMVRAVEYETGARKPPSEKTKTSVKKAKSTKLKTKAPDSSKSAKAKASHKPSTKPMQIHAENNEIDLAKALNAEWVPGNEPPVALLETEYGTAAIEVKTFLDNKYNKINMSPDSRVKKEAYSENTGQVFHTVLFDDQDAWGNDHQYSGHRIYYRPGVGAYYAHTMIKVKDFQELEKLIVAAQSLENIDDLSVFKSPEAVKEFLLS